MLAYVAVVTWSLHDVSHKQPAGTVSPLSQWTLASFHWQENRQLISSPECTPVFESGNNGQYCVYYTGDFTVKYIIVICHCHMQTHRHNLWDKLNCYCSWLKQLCFLCFLYFTRKTSVTIAVAVAATFWMQLIGWFADSYIYWDSLYIQDAAAFMIMDPEHKMLNILQHMMQLYAFMFPV